MVHIAINDNCSAIFHQETLVIEVVFKGWMLNRANMVRTDIEKNSYIKGQAVDSLDQVGLTGYFHDEVGSSIINSLGHHVKKVNTFRSCQSRFEESFTVQGSVHC